MQIWVDKDKRVAITLFSELYKVWETYSGKARHKSVILDTVGFDSRFGVQALESSQWTLS